MEDDFLKDTWTEIISELKSKPLHNSSHDMDDQQIDKWWNSSGDQPNQENSIQKGEVLSLNDWGNMVEFWYSVRNNLFHGGKNPDVQRDLFLVKNAYLTLRQFMTAEVSNLV